MATKIKKLLPDERRVIINGVENKVRKLQASKEAIKELKKAGQTKREIFGFFAINRPEVEKTIVTARTHELRKWAEMNNKQKQAYRKMYPDGIDFIPHDGLKKFDIFCDRCGERQGWLWSEKKDLENWVDFHYTQWHDANSWYGCLTPNISPIDSLLAFECTCGEDVRDYRTMNSLPPLARQYMIEYSLKHRGFNHKDAKFSVKEVKNG